MTLWLDDGDVRLFHGDALEVLRQLPDASVDCVVTSPPYWGLRDYGTGSWDGGDPDCDHIAAPHSSMRPERSRATSDTFHGSMSTNHGDSAGTPYRDVCGKCGATRVDRQMGLEPTPDLFVQGMVELFREVRRVLAPHGTCWVNLGDSYAQGHGGSSTEGAYTMRKAARGDATNPERREPLRCTWCGWLAPTHTALADHVRDARHSPDDDGNYRRKGGVRNVVPNMKPKDLCGIPWRVAFALQADGWWLRSDIIWSKPNPMPESVTDRPTKAHEYVFLLTKQPRYWFDAEAVRESAAGWIGSASKEELQRRATKTKKPDGWDTGPGGHGTVHRDGREKGAENYVEAKGRNVRSVWTIATQPYPEAHFATFPEELARRCILAGCPERVCRECGKPSERIVDTSYEKSPVHGAGSVVGRHYETGANNFDGAGMPRLNKVTETVGWSDCGHNNWRTGVVLDPFIGSGTTAKVARDHQRHAIGIDLNQTYLELAARRLQQLSLLT